MICGQDRNTEMEFYFEAAVTCWRDVKWERTKAFFYETICQFNRDVNIKYLGNSQLRWNISEMVIGYQVEGSGCEYVAV